MLLHQSAQWNRDKGINSQLLEETRQDNKDYIGKSVPLPISYPELKRHEEKIRMHIQHYCPKFNPEKHPIFLFSQIFAS